MESVMHNDYRQQPIMSDEACRQYQRYLGRLEALVADQEDVVIQARTHADEAELSRAHASLWRLLTKRQGVVDALAAYKQQHAGVR